VVTVDRFPVPESRRRFYEAIIRLVDLFVYAAVFGGGVYALVFTPQTVTEQLEGFPLLVVMWSFLLMAGGLVGFVGRLVRHWMTEVPATVAAVFGIAIYLVILGRYAFSSITATVAVALIIVAMLFMVRRWAELQIFSTEPGASSFRDRAAAALRRRTADAVAHNH
jgi:hypothetical protein